MKPAWVCSHNLRCGRFEVAARQFSTVFVIVEVAERERVIVLAEIAVPEGNRPEIPLPWRCARVAREGREVDRAAGEVIHFTRNSRSLASISPSQAFSFAFKSWTMSMCS